VPRVVVSRRIFPALVADLQREFDVRANQDDVAWSASELAAALSDADGALLTAGDRIDETLLAQCPRLKVVANIAVGINNLDLAACTRHGVLATNTPEVLNEATADHAWALLLAAARRVGESERWLRAGLWKRWTFEMFMGAAVSDCAPRRRLLDAGDLSQPDPAAGRSGGRGALRPTA
jgi:glyoxylate/hydroxypyruvate/2-ketogluconate reductase